MPLSKAAREERAHLYTDGLRRCSSCSEVKTLDEFQKDASKDHGLRSRCKRCDAATNARKLARRREKWATADPYADPSPKRCWACGQHHPRTSFSTAPSNLDGLSGVCKPCRASKEADARDSRREKWATADPYADPSQKRCVDCGQHRPRSAFSTNPSTPDGLGAICRECAVAVAAQYRVRNREKWATADPFADLSPRRCGGCAQLRPRSDFSTAPTSSSGLTTYCLACCADREATKRALYLGTAAAAISREDIYRRDGGRCFYCGAEVPQDAWHLDHVMALVNGGPHEPWNVVVSCPADNLAKGAKEWPRVGFNADGTHDSQVYPRGVMPVYIDGVKWIDTTPITSLN